MTRLDEAAIARLRELNAKATKGPWRLEQGNRGPLQRILFKGSIEYGKRYEDAHGNSDGWELLGQVDRANGVIEYVARDAELIVAMRNAIDALLDEREALRAECVRLGNANLDAITKAQALEDMIRGLNEQHTIGCASLEEDGSGCDCALSAASAFLVLLRDKLDAERAKVAELVRERDEWKAECEETEGRVEHWRKVALSSTFLEMQRRAEAAEATVSTAYEGSNAGFLEQTSGKRAECPHPEGSQAWELWQFGYGSAQAAHWRDRAEQAEAEVERLRDQARHVESAIRAMQRTDGGWAVAYGFVHDPDDKLAPDALEIKRRWLAVDAALAGGTGTSVGGRCNVPTSGDE